MARGNGRDFVSGRAIREILEVGLSRQRQEIAGAGGWWCCILRESVCTAVSPATAAATRLALRSNCTLHCTRCLLLKLEWRSEPTCLCESLRFLYELLSLGTAATLWGNDCA